MKSINIPLFVLMSKKLELVRGLIQYLRKAQDCAGKVPKFNLSQDRLRFSYSCAGLMVSILGLPGLSPRMPEKF